MTIPNDKHRSFGKYIFISFYIVEFVLLTMTSELPGQYVWLFFLIAITALAQLILSRWKLSAAALLLLAAALIIRDLHDRRVMQQKLEQIIRDHSSSTAK
jgi:membrane protein implicated in regulation of membrane protease activity